ncbi:MAG: hypothetical protein J6B40_06875 [Oscillospiraceae bacterium]|nr:hypothetical protein [Oscillospiraceae bacterium]
MISFPLGPMTLRIHWSFLLLLGLLAAAPNSDLLLLGLGSALCHELGHLGAMWAVGMPPSCLQLTLFGGKLRGSSYPNLWAELAALAAGAGVNLALALCFGFLPQYRFQLFSAINLVMGGFNLLPIQGLDGGRMLRLGLERFCGPHRAAKWCAFLSFAVLAVLWGWGLWMWRQHPGLPALLGMPLLAAAVFFDWCKKQ